MPAQHAFCNFLLLSLIFRRVMVVIASISILFMVTKNGRTSFVPLVSGLALWARLISILPLVFVAGPTDRKCTDIASNEGFPIKSFANIFTTYLADLAPQTFQGLSPIFSIGFHHWSTSLPRRQEKNTKLTRRQQDRCICRGSHAPSHVLKRQSESALSESFHFQGSFYTSAKASKSETDLKSSGRSGG